MSIGSFDIDTTTPPLSGVAVTILVCRYVPTSDPALTGLPNVECLRLDIREGPAPMVGQFRYIQDDSLALNFGWPSQFEELWPIDAQGPYVVNADDRIVVLSGNPDGSYDVLFDGFAQIPQVHLTDHAQAVTFTAIGVAIRAWDSPIRGRWQRSASNPQADSSSGPIGTDLPTRFNPSDTLAVDGNKAGIVPNCTPDGYNVNQSDVNTSYPVFLEHGLERTPDPRTYWTVSKAVRYILASYNNQLFVTNPPFGPLDSMLQAMYPAPGYDVFDPDNPSDYQSADIAIRDYDATDRAWPDVISDFLGYAGFAMRFVTAADMSGMPATTLDIYRRDAANPIVPKSVYLDQARAPSLDLAKNNVNKLRLERNLNAVVNHFSIESPLKQIELSFVLAPAFQPQAGDQFAANRRSFLRSQLTGASATVKRKYRWYIIDECGDGHWNATNGVWSMGPFDFSAIFPPSPSEGPGYVERYRAGSRTLISVDSDGHPLRADLSISFDYTGAMPGIWNGSGTWASINGGWELLRDRLGIEVTVEDPENWNAGKTVGDIRGITWQASPPGGVPTNGNAFALRLTTVIADDRMLSAKAGKRIASPTQFTRRRRADARDHFQFNRVVGPSLNNQTADDLIDRDDTALAQAHARQLRSAHEFPPLCGTIELPFATAYYGIGDRLQAVAGRNVSLQTNIGIDQGEMADYPVIVALSWIFELDRQATLLQLADRRLRF